MWNLVPWPRMEPDPLHWEHGVLTIGPPGNSWEKCFFNEIFSEKTSTHLLQNGQPWEWCSLLTDKCCCSVTKSDIWHIWLFVTPWTAAHHASLSFTVSYICSNSCPLSQWCHSTISSSVIPFSSCLRSFPASGSFPMSQLFASGGQSTGASASVLPKNSQG